MLTEDLPGMLTEDLPGMVDRGQLLILSKRDLNFCVCCALLRGGRNGQPAINPFWKTNTPVICLMPCSQRPSSFQTAGGEGFEELIGAGA